MCGALPLSLSHPGQVTSPPQSPHLFTHTLAAKGEFRLSNQPNVSLNSGKQRKPTQARRKHVNSTERPKLDTERPRSEPSHNSLQLQYETQAVTAVCYLRTAASCNTPSAHSRQPNGEGTCRGLLVFAETTVLFVSNCNSGP